MVVIVERGKAMTTKIWQAESIKHHLLAVQTGTRAGVPDSLIPDGDGDLAAYREGCEAMLKFMAERFGIDLERTEATRQRQTGELRLKTWTRQDIERNLNVAWKIMGNGSPAPQKQDERLVAYYQGIRNTIEFLAISFGIDRFTLPDAIR